ncbi:MAG: hypothetical protein AB7G75_33470 [Candidatus Binatia bacterium]
MKLVNLKNPVMASWLREQGFRLDAPPFLSAPETIREARASRPAPSEEIISSPQGFTIAAALQQKPNTNPYVTHLLTLYS